MHTAAVGMKKKRAVGKILWYVLLTLFAAVYIYPVFIMVLNSFKSFGEVVSDPIAWPKVFTLQNYKDVAEKIH